MYHFGKDKNGRYALYNEHSVNNSFAYSKEEALKEYLKDSFEFSEETESWQLINGTLMHDFEQQEHPAYYSIESFNTLDDLKNTYPELFI